jgi:hypothetical protein
VAGFLEHGRAGSWGRARNAETGTDLAACAYTGKAAALLPSAERETWENA